MEGVGGADTHKLLQRDKCFLLRLKVKHLQMGQMIYFFNKLGQAAIIN